MDKRTGSSFHYTRTKLRRTFRAASFPLISFLVASFCPSDCIASFRSSDLAAYIEIAFRLFDLATCIAAFRSPDLVVHIEIASIRSSDLATHIAIAVEPVHQGLCSFIEVHCLPS